MANEERKPLTRFMAQRTANGGWVISSDLGEYMKPDAYSYSSDRDMLAALPGLIGMERPMSNEEIYQALKSDRQRSDDAVEETKAAMGMLTGKTDETWPENQQGDKSIFHHQV